jgi:predicted metalloprotease
LRPSPRVRLLLLGATAVVALLVVAAQITGSASGSSAPSRLTTAPTEDGAPQDTADFLTAVTEDVDRYWTGAFADAGLGEPRVGYAWISPGGAVQSACGPLDESAAAYCPGDDTIYISERFADAIHAGALDRALPGSSQGYGGTLGDFAVAYIVAHEYGHQIQDELGLFDRYGDRVPTMALELQADCFAGVWARSAGDQGRLEAGDVEEALDAALAVGDFDTASPGHHGTPEQRREAWSTGFEAGEPGACSAYLPAA